MRRITVRKFLALLATVSLAVIAGMTLPVPTPAQNTQANISRGFARWNATAYGSWRSSVVQGTLATGVGTIIVNNPNALVDGRMVMPFSVTAPVSVDGEIETPTTVAAATCPGGAQATNGCTAITATWTAIHPGGQNDVTSGTFGLQEAYNEAHSFGGGIVEVDPSWAGTTVIIGAVVPFPDVAIEDDRFGTVQYWTAHQSTATVIAAPATLTATTVGFGLNGANTTGGTYTGASTYFVAVACVDLMGNESQPSATFSALTAGTGTTNQIGFAFPVAQTGCVGYVPYISLAGGSYALAYRVPVATYTNGIPTANGVCTLTTIEKITAACAMPNATYGQSGSNAIVSALTVNTARIWVGVGGTSTTADLVGNSNARQTYALVPGARLNPPGITANSLVFSTPTAAATGVPSVLATVQVPPAFMNFISRKLRVCAHISEATGGTATVETFTFVWDADGSNTTGAGVTLGNGITGTITETAAATSFNVCGTIVTTVSGAGVTAGSIKDALGYFTMAGGVVATSNLAGTDTSIGTTGSLNVAGEARIDLVYTHTTGTDGAGLIVQDLTVEDVT